MQQTYHSRGKCPVMNGQALRPINPHTAKCFGQVSEVQQEKRVTCWSSIVGCSRWLSESCKSV